jgi:hypothetical protein
VGTDDKKINKKGWRCTSVVEHLPSMHKALGSITKTIDIYIYTHTYISYIVCWMVICREKQSRKGGYQVWVGGWEVAILN